MGNSNGVIEEGERIEKICPECQVTFQTYRAGTGKTIKGPFQEEQCCRVCMQQKIVECGKILECAINTKKSSK
jgi:hypothetical protein